MKYSEPKAREVIFGTFGAPEPPRHIPVGCTRRDIEQYLEDNGYGR